MALSGNGARPDVGTARATEKIMDHAIARTIVDQIGNHAFVMMGAVNLVSDERSLTFKVRGSRLATHVKVELDPSDTYTVTFYKIRKFDVREVGSVGMVYADALRLVIASGTGLALSL